MTKSTEARSVGIIAPLDFEARSAQPLAQRGWTVQVSGVGAEYARRAAEQLLAAGAQRLLVWGVAGGLDPELKAGTIFLPDTVINATEGKRFTVAASWHSQLASVLTSAGIPLIGNGELATVAKPVVTPADKSALAAGTGALMVDMEAAAVAEVAARAGVGFAVLRVLVDEAGMSLPPTVLAAAGRPHPHRSVITGLLKRPQDLPAILRLGRSFQFAHRSLSVAAEALAAVRVNWHI